MQDTHQHECGSDPDNESRMARNIHSTYSGIGHGDLLEIERDIRVERAPGELNCMRAVTSGPLED